MIQQEGEKFRPYAAPANMIAVLGRVRSRNLPEAIDSDFLRIAGIPDAASGRVAQAFKFLGFVHEDQRPTDTLTALAGAPEAEYKELLAGAIREAYRDDFTRIDPSEDAQGQIVDAFMPYEPRSQTSRMVMLFLGLCREAGIPVLDAPRERSMKPVTRKRQSVQRRSSGGTQSSGTDPQSKVPGLLFGVTEEDIAKLGDAEFEEVWRALGKVARARAQSTGSAIDPETNDSTQENEKL